MHHFFISQDRIRDGRVFLDGDDAHHIVHVLRMRSGDTIEVSDNADWLYTARIEIAQTDVVQAVILDAQKAGKELPSRIVLFQCLPKGDKMETIIQKAVELGVAEIVPVVSARSIPRLDVKKGSAKVQRWNAIAKHAAEQSRRLRIPTVQPILSFADMLEQADARCRMESTDTPVLLLPYEKADDLQETHHILEEIRPGTPVGMLIGPEGGFDEAEVRSAQAAGYMPITLGKRILRTETASLALLSILAYLLET